MKNKIFRVMVDLEEIFETVDEVFKYRTFGII